MISELILARRVERRVLDTARGTRAVLLPGEAGGSGHLADVLRGKVGAGTTRSKTLL